MDKQVNLGGVVFLKVVIHLQSLHHPAGQHAVGLPSLVILTGWTKRFKFYFIVMKQVQQHVIEAITRCTRSSGHSQCNSLQVYPWQENYSSMESRAPRGKPHEQGENIQTPHVRWPLTPNVLAVSKQCLHLCHPKPEHDRHKPVHYSENWWHTSHLLPLSSLSHETL